MARKPRWDERDINDGVGEVRLSHWKYFSDWVLQEMLDYKEYVYRGQRSASWPLLSSLDRAILQHPEERRGKLWREHLSNFQLASRGRRGPHPRRIDDENEWWALGQHHGLATPLLDWTESPFVALYFAMWEDVDKPPGQRAAVWALATTSTEKKSARIRRAQKSPGGKRPPVVEVHRPQTDENLRLVSQRGLFVRGPDGSSIDDWVRKHFKGDDQGFHLMKITMPSKGRVDCLRYLNSMNINHLSLFPDLYGASKHANTALAIQDY